MKTKLLSLSLCFYTIGLFACKNAYQFRVFPIGFHNEYLVSIDYKLYRTSQMEGSKVVDFKLDSSKMTEVMWILIGSVSKYDLNQNIIESATFDTTYSLERVYLGEMAISFKKGLKLITEKYPRITFFKPTNIYFCDFSISCSVANIRVDSIHNNSFIDTDSSSFEISIIQEKNFYGFDNSPFYTNNLENMVINSVRTYDSAPFELFVFHEATFDMRKNSGEYKPFFEFEKIDETIFHEPILHHGFVVDLFTIKKK